MWFKNHYRRHNERKLAEARQEQLKYAKPGAVLGEGTTAYGTYNGSSNGTNNSEPDLATAPKTYGHRGLRHAKSFFEYLQASAPATPAAPSLMSVASGSNFELGEIDAKPLELSEQITLDESGFHSAIDTVDADVLTASDPVADPTRSVRPKLSAVELRPSEAEPKPKLKPKPLGDVTNEPIRSVRPKTSAVCFHLKQVN